MTPPYDLRQMSEAQFRQEIQTMDNRTLDKAVNGIGGPKVTRLQERTISRELDHRRLDDMYAAQLADEAQEKYSGNVDPLLNDDAIDTLGTQGPDDLLADYDALPGGELPPPSDPGMHGGASPPPIENTSTSSPQLSESEREALLLLGVILYEAVMLKRTKDTIQAHLNDADDLFLVDSTIPEQICDYLWSDLSVSERAPHVNTILGDDGESARTEIESLCQSIGLDIS